MILGGELTPVGNLSAAFMSPQTPMHLQFAYYESALVVEFLVERSGIDSLKAILADLAKGGEINAAIGQHAGPLDKIERRNSRPSPESGPRPSRRAWTGSSRLGNSSTLPTRRRSPSGSASTPTASGP